MREVTIGGEKVQLVGAVLTPWIYEDEFDADMATALRSGDLMTYGKLAYALARTAKYPAAFPDFKAWIESIGGWDPSEPGVAEAVVLEATRACFPRNPAMVAAVKRRIAANAVQAPAEPELPRDGEEDGPVPD